MTNEYERGQKDMLALIKDTYYKAGKSEFERLLDAEGKNELQEFLRHEYIEQGMKIERIRLLEKIRKLTEKYGIDWATTKSISKKEHIRCTKRYARAILNLS